MGSPTRFPAGVTNNAVWQTLGQAGFPDPAFYHVYYNEFDTLNASDFVVTDTGAATNALTNEDGGVLLNTTTTGASDATFLQVPKPTFAFVPATSSVAGKKSFFKTRVKLSDSTNSSFVCGLTATGSTTLSIADGLYFYKATGAQTFVLRSTSGSTSTDLALTGFSFADATYIELGWYYDGKGTVQAFVNDLSGYVSSSSAVSTALTKGAVASFTPTLTTALLSPSMGMQNGAGASKTFSVDFLLAARER